MRTAKISIFVAIIAAASMAFASGPVGTVTSSENFVLSGSEISVAGVPSWPVVAGDQLQTRSASAMLRLSDGSRVVINRNSRVTLEQVGSATRVKLISGSLRYSAKHDSMLEIIANQVSAHVGAYASGTAFLDGTKGIIAADVTPANPSTYVPATVFTPGPLTLPTLTQLTTTTTTPPPPPPIITPGTGIILPFLSARP